MDDDEIEKIAKRLARVDKIIKKLDPTIRIEAFSLFRPYISDSKTIERDINPDQGDTEVDASEFFTKHQTDKPADTVLSVCAYFYSRYGSTPFTVGDVKELGDRVGLTLPERIDMTIRAARRDGKTLFQSAGRGSFRPTVHGENFLKTTYRVTKGREKRAEQQGS